MSNFLKEKLDYFASLSDAERLNVLQANADSAERLAYMEDYSDDEKQIMKEQLTEIVYNIEDLDDEKKATVKDFNESLKKLNQQKKELLKDIKHSRKELEDTCYKFVDLERRKAHYFSKRGDCVRTRHAYPDELSPKLSFESYPLNGTNN